MFKSMPIQKKSGNQNVTNVVGRIVNWPKDSKLILFKLGNRRKVSYFDIQKIPFRYGILEIRV